MTKTVAEMLAEVQAKRNAPAPTPTSAPTKVRDVAHAAKPADYKPPVHPEVRQQRSILWGTGMTQKVIAKQAREVTAQAQRDAEQLERERQAAIAAHTPLITPTMAEATLPTSLLGTDLEDDEWQDAAVAGAVGHSHCVIFGEAGTGKTTTTKRVIHDKLATLPTIRTHRDTFNAAVCFCAYTGKAVQQMKRAIPAEYHDVCDTIHGTLGYAPVYEEYIDKGELKTRRVFRPTYTEYNKLPYKLCVVDEGGMVPIYLHNQLMKALPEDCHVVYLGDLAQLPPIHGHSVLGHAMIRWPDYELKTIHRTAADNPIIMNAHRVARGMKPINDKATKRFVMHHVVDKHGMEMGSMGTFKHTLAVIQHLHKEGQFDPMRDGFIVPQNVGPIGQEEFNKYLVRYFNPTRHDEEGNVVNKRHVVTAGYEHKIFAVGDKIMLTQNDRERGLTNGMQGVITEMAINGAFTGDAMHHHAEIHAEAVLTDEALSSVMAKLDATHEEETEAQEAVRQASHIIRVKFQNYDEIVDFTTAGQVNALVHSYAFTCHKAQGSEYPTVVILVHSANYTMLSREWLYTAITRAQERVILLYQNRGLTMAVNKQRIQGDTVQEKAQQFIKLQEQYAREYGADDDEGNGKIPLLPESKVVEVIPQATEEEKLK